MVAKLFSALQSGADLALLLERFSWPPHYPLVERRTNLAVDKDRSEGAAKNIGGKIKEGTGKLTGDTKTEAEGKNDQVEGKVQNTIDGIKDTLRGK
jgi:uncharacterized protein YjbJ (UPF0337 family)